MRLRFFTLERQSPTRTASEVVAHCETRRGDVILPVAEILMTNTLYISNLRIPTGV
jgi:hypothetical protein